jgi:hypothetical protein
LPAFGRERRFRSSLGDGCRKGLETSTTRILPPDALREGVTRQKVGHLFLGLLVVPQLTPLANASKKWCQPGLADP